MARDCVDKETTRSCVVEPHEVSPGDGLMIYRLLGAVGLVVLVWLAGLAVKAQIHSTRAEIARQDARIVEKLVGWGLRTECCRRSQLDVHWGLTADERGGGLRSHVGSGRCWLSRLMQPT